jgi:TolB-like protein
MGRAGIFFVLLAAVSAGALGQTKPRLAILPFTGENHEDAESIAEFFSYEDEINRVFTPVPRTSAIETLMREQEFQRSGLTDSDTIADLGRQLSADYVLAGHIAELAGSKLLLITIIDVQRLQQIAGDYRQYQQIERVVDILPGMARKIAAAAGRDVSKLPRLAVLPFNTLSSGMELADAELLAQILATELANSGQYAVFPRTKEIEKVMDLHNIERSGLTDPESLKQIGEAVNAQYVLSANARKLGADNYFSASILHIIEASQGEGTREKYRDVLDGLVIMPRIAYRLMGMALPETFAGDAEAFASATSAINRAKAGGTYTITLTGSFEGAPVVLASPGADRTVILRGDGTRRVVKNGGTSAFITVQKGVNLTLEGSVTIDGNGKTARLVTINDGGALTVKTGATLSGSKGGGVYVSSDGKFAMSGGTISGNATSGTNGGGGVSVSGGSFTMSGGTINGNTAHGGGGVFAYSGGSFTMSGGTISGNTASANGSSGGGVLVGNSAGSAIFTMSGGEISKNTAAYGGGVYAYSGSFTMSGGRISGNTASGEGGGVDVGSSTGSAVFTMTGGTISANTANQSGGGVRVYSGSFTMSIGTISGNTAAHGGGVYVYNGSFVMSGGTINGNTASSNGGGVDVGSNTGNAVFTMTGGTISGNTAKNNNGGGVRVYSGSFTMSGGGISGNTTAYGGGVYVNRGAFEMTGGTIGGNTASGNNGGGGGGVYVSGGNFTMSDGEISKNTTASGGGVYVSSSEDDTAFTMSGGTISGNTASSNGGGVDVYRGTFEMTGGTINGNTASGENYGGGGVDVDGNTGNAVFTMSGGTINGNTAKNSGGGGVRVYSGSFTMSAGEISKNTAVYGGGIYVYRGSFVKSGGGTIDGANSAANGKTVYVYGGGKQRNSAAGRRVNLDSSKSGRTGGWERVRKR